MSATSVSYGQSIVGLVHDSLNNPISFASVVATSCQDDQVLAFTNTDDQGRFQLTVKTGCDSITVAARSLGYRTKSYRIAIRDLPAEREFVLASTVLEEVMVHGKTPPVIARNDTTEYNVASFSDSTEVSVEDLLKKLPGVRVAENGLITYNGKTVERVMIDGDDLFSQNYTLATRNIRADLISKVQVIDRFQENPLLKGIQESDRMVMNLKIKPERKRTLSGNAELGG
ncbi:MAG: carboxypeptidase-like regulatory domain-containing protein, partial [Saprospiraceae bacterium]|nr:carboxypeptidase-like regulatory domain-containing protein [Saprospiraceae bacterium]